MRKYTPIGRITANLRRRFQNDEALVLADWCESHDLLGMARQLRLGQGSARARRMITELSRMFGACYFIKADDRSFNEWRVGEG